MKLGVSKVGIRFLYISAIKNNPLRYNPPIVQELGNKVSFSTGYPNLQYFVQIFQKNPQDSLKTAVEKTFLTGYSPADCYFKMESPYNRYQNGYQDTLETGMIDFPFSNEYGSGGTQRSFAAFNKCPKDYIQAGEVKNYFAMDSKHPNKYAFIHIGGSNIVSRNERPNPSGVTYVTSWDETLQFVN